MLVSSHVCSIYRNVFMHYNKRIFFEIAVITWVCVAFNLQTSSECTLSEPPTPIIKLETSWTDVFKTEKLRFSCTGPDSIWTLTWYKDQKKLETEGSALNIDSVTKDDKGVYTCKAEIKPRGVSSASSDTKVITVYGKFLLLSFNINIKKWTNYNMLFLECS